MKLSDIRLQEKIADAETFASQKDISIYNRPSPVEPVPTINKTTDLLYSNMTTYRKDGCRVNRPCSFLFLQDESPLPLTVTFNVNATNPGQPGSVNLIYLPGAGKLCQPFNVFAGIFS